MAWKTTSDAIVISDKTTKAMIADKRVDVDIPGAIEYHVHGNVLFFATTRMVVKERRGLTYAGAKAYVDATGSQESQWKSSIKRLSVAVVDIPFESFSRTTSMRRVDDSGQYVVTIEENTTVTDGEEHPIN